MAYPDDGLLPGDDPLKTAPARPRFPFLPYQNDEDGMLPRLPVSDGSTPGVTNATGSGMVVPIDTRTPNRIQRLAQTPEQLQAGVQPGAGQLAPTGQTDAHGRPMLAIQAKNDLSGGLGPDTTAPPEVSTADGLVPSLTPPGTPAGMPNLPAPAAPRVVQAPTPMQTMQQKAADLSGLGPRPATNADLAPGQAHHGWRKALDVAAAVGMGAYTMNPLAGVGVYKMMNGAPLRRAQETYDAKQEKAKEGFEGAKSVEQENVGEGRVQSLQDKNKGLEEDRDARAAKANAQFVAGTETQDANSPTGWTAQTVGGETKPFQPKRTKSDDFQDQQGMYEKEADRLKLQGDDRMYYIANHKLREPNPNQGQIDEERAARLQRGREHDDEQRDQHYQTMHQRWAEHKSAIEKEQEAQYAKVETEWRKKYGPTGADVLDKRDKSEEKQAALAELDRQKQLIESTVQQRFKELGPEPQPRGHAQATENATTETADSRPPADESEIAKPEFDARSGAPLQKPSPGTPATPQAGVTPVTKQQVQVGQQVMVGNKVKYVVGINPKNGKVQTSDQPPAK